MKPGNLFNHALYNPTRHGCPSQDCGTPTGIFAGAHWDWDDIRITSDKIGMHHDNIVANQDNMGTLQEPSVLTETHQDNIRL